MLGLVGSGGISREDSSAMVAPRSSSYSQTLKSSSIVGGAQAVSLVLGMVRTKLVALLLGPTGVGLIGLYDSVISLTGTLTNLDRKSVV